jgi:hypothetical protein
LEAALYELRPYFLKAGYSVPANVRVSIGWPHGARGGKGSETIGQCWDMVASSDKHFEIFISPSMKDGARICDVLAHELCHAIAGHKAGHKGPFKAIATAIGLEGKMTATTAGPAMKAWAEGFVEKHGAYPAGSLSPSKGRKKQGTRLIKCECSECGYIARTTAKWIEEAGAPYCGVKSHGRMVAEEGDE